MKSTRSILLALCAAVALLCAGPALAQNSKKLFLFNWTQYMNPKIIKQFETKYHVQVVQSYYSSMPELFAKLRAGGDRQYDVIVPSQYYVPRLIKTGLIQPLNKAEIPNYKNLLPKFQNPSFDPGGKYTAAYQWGTTGIAYNTKLLGKQQPSWSILFDPKVNSSYPFVLGTDAQVMLGAACAYQGHGYNCTGRNDWKQAAKLIVKTKNRSNFNGFSVDTPMLKQLARGNLAAGVAYNGDYVYDKKNNPKGFANIEFVVPKEGAELWVDNMAIPAHAPHPKLANEFINFILQPKIGAELSNYNSYASPNGAARPYLNKELTQPPITPTPAQMKYLHYTPSIKGAQLQFVQQLWTEVQSQ